MGFIQFLIDPVTFIARWLQMLLVGWGIPAGWTQFILFVLGAGALGTGALMFTIALIWFERKLIGRFQDRFGPNRVGPWGIFQPFADMGKIFTKEYITPDGADPVPFYLAPILVVMSVVSLWAVIPFTLTVVGVELNVGVLYIIGIGGIGELAIIFAGWGSNNKYAMLAAFRALAQLISYEVPMVIALLMPVMFSGKMGLNDIVQAQDVWYIVLCPLAALIFFITSTAENGRTPFDLLEADSELVAGFNIEYSGLRFGFYYVADFLHAFTIGLLFAILFLGGWRGPFVEQVPVLGVFYLFAKAGIVYFIGNWMRASLPRFRIDQMMDVNWKILTPTALALVILTAVVDKLIAPELLYLQAAILFVLNVALLVVIGKVIDWYWARRPRPKVVATLRPVARYERTSAQPHPGAGQ